jgi:hypothetical protein
MYKSELKSNSIVEAVDWMCSAYVQDFISAMAVFRTRSISVTMSSTGGGILFCTYMLGSRRLIVFG